VRNVGGVVGLKRRHLWVVHLLQECGSSEERDELEPEPKPSFIEMHTAFACTLCHSSACKTSASVMNKIF
jgi:hypothetical protein